MEDIFISHIHINEVRHLKNIDIPLSEEKRQHLILTGKNGSGKTSVLQELKLQFEQGIEKNGFVKIADNIIAVAKMKRNIKNIDEGLFEGEQKDSNQLLELFHTLTGNESEVQKYVNLNLTIQNIFGASQQYQNGNFILAYFDAKRTTIAMHKPLTIQKLELKSMYSISEKPSIDFIQYIVNLKADSSFARDDNDMKAVKEVDNWFAQFENSLKHIFNEKDLQLRFDRKNYNFDIVLNGHKAFDFTTLSDGYSAILSIVIEIMMRMENKSSRNYNIQGIVFIDEIETHLHIDLQKKILPFLTSFFPKIQFVVTTHSPFVLTSVDNAVIFDLEKQLKLENLSGYSSEAIVESYFESDKYSDILKAQVKRYEWLLNLDNPTMEQKDEIESLRAYFKQLPKFLAPELQLTINQLELAQLV